MIRRRAALVRLLALGLALGLVAAACGDGDDGGSSGSRLSGSVRVDGSSTVAPLSEKAAEDFMAENKGVRVTVGTSGTGGGFEKFCKGETDISDASRPIKTSEADICKAAGITYAEVQVANDGLAVIVNPDNTWAKCLTVEQLKKVWDAPSTVSNWNQIDSSFPNQKLTLFGAGTDSGTFDYFTEVINGKSQQSRKDYTATEDDNVTITGVAGDKGGMGFLGLSYVEQNKGKVKAVDINGGKGCVAPSTKTVQDGTYTPLGRPIFIYPAGKALGREEVLAFVDYYLDNIDAITKAALFVPMTATQLAAAKAKVASLHSGGSTTTTVKK